MQPIDTTISKFAKALSLTSWGKKLTFVTWQEKDLTILPQISVVADGACRSARELTSATIPAAIKCIGVAAFSCPKLKNVTFKPRTDRDELYIKERAFDATPELTSLVLPLGAITLESNVFGPELKQLRFLGAPPNVAPDTFASATGLKRVEVAPQYLSAYRKLFAAVSDNIKVERYVTPEERREAERKLRQEREQKAKEEAQARKRPLTLRLTIPLRQRCRIRLGQTNVAITPNIISESNLVANIEILPDGEKTPIKVADFKITKHTDWNDMRERPQDFRFDGVPAEKLWSMTPEAPTLAKEIFQAFLTGDADTAERTIRLLAAGRDNYIDRRAKAEVYPVLLIDDIAENLILEYRMLFDPENFDPKKLRFFSMREYQIDDDDEYCRAMSRWGNVHVENLQKIRAARVRGMEAYDLEDEKADDVILWYDFIGYGNDFGTLTNVYLEETGRDPVFYDCTNPPI